MEIGKVGQIKINIGVWDSALLVVCVTLASAIIFIPIAFVVMIILAVIGAS